MPERAGGGPMTHCPMPSAASGPTPLPDGVVPISDPPTALPVPRLLWGWPENVHATGIPRRTLERELSAGRFPKPIKRVGRRPYWRPADVIAWAEGSCSP
jgi:predicted DNA-binding transcriptional regulator AlpA